MRRLAIAAACFLAVQVSAKEPDYSKFVAEAKDTLVRDFKDPPAAQFRDLFLSKHTNAKTGVERVALCGQFNAKNAYGAYIGYRPFAVVDLQPLVAMNDSDIYGPIMKAVCKTPFKKL